LLSVLYLTLCLLVAFLGRHRGLGFLPIFLLSILLTPLITLIVMLLTQGVERVAVAASGDGAHVVRGTHGAHAVTCHRCNHRQKELQAIEFCTHCGEPL